MKNIKIKVLPILSLILLVYLIMKQTPVVIIWLIGFYINVATVLYEMILNKKEFYRELDELEEYTEGLISRKWLMLLLLIVCMFSFLVLLSRLINKNKKE